MPAYDCPIKINREKQDIHCEQSKTIERGFLYASDFEFAGKDAFNVIQDEDGNYTITVNRVRLETDLEQNARIKSEERYMEEYNKRH